MKKLIIFLILIFSVSTSFAGVDFDQVDDFLNCGTDSSLDISEGSLSVWFNCTDLSEFGLQSITCKDLSGGNDGDFIFLVWPNGFGSNENTLLFRTQDVGGANDVRSDSGIFFGVWNHAVLLWGSGGMSMYLNNVLQSATDASTTGMTNAAASFLVGNTRVGASEFFDGEINEIAVWDVNLSVGEIDTLFNSMGKRMPLQIQGSNLQAYWALDDEPDGSSSDGDTFNDGSSNTNTCTGDDGGNNSGLTAVAESRFSYP